MEHETQTRADHGETGQRIPPEEAIETAWQAFQLWTGSRDATRFREAYVGTYADRAAFGTELAWRLGADVPLARLPPWLLAYLRIDGDAVAADFVAAGHFHIYDLPDGSGCHVFDSYA